MKKIDRSIDMAVPDGFDLFNSSGISHDSVDPKSHPLYPRFLEVCKDLGYDIDSEGFKDYESAYFGFFLAGSGPNVIIDD